MKLENQVCSLELSKRLKELGVKQKSYFIWANNNLIPRISMMELDKHELFETHICAAFTVAELGEMLPASLSNEDILFISKGPDFYNAYYNHNIYGLSYYGFICKYTTFANCLADLLLSLLENKLMELPNE